MTSTWFFIVIEVSIVACALVSGVFLTFSDFVMRSLNSAEPVAGVEVMQVINREVFRSIFMGLLLGMSALSPFLAGFAYFNLSGSVSALIMVGGMLYFIGVFVVSLVFNVPMNNQLDTKEYSGKGAAIYWKNIYYPRWTFWNYIRAIAAGGAAVCFLVSSVWIVQGGIIAA